MTATLLPDRRSTVARYAAAASVLALALTAALLPPDAAAQARKDSVVLGITLEPAPGLDPTMAPAGAWTRQPARLRPSRKSRCTTSTRR